MEELIIKEREAREKLTSLINELGLPAFILKPIIKDLYEQINNAEIEQYKQAQEYIQKKEEENKKKEKEE